MRVVALFIVSMTLFGQAAPKTDAAAETRKVAPEAAEEQELNTALQQAGNSGVDFIRALENHLKKYPTTKQRQAIERALFKAASEAKDDARVVLYGERVVAVEPLDLQVMDRYLRSLLLKDDAETATKALAYAIRYQQEIEKVGDHPPPGRFNPVQWKEEVDKGIARALVYQARANGNLGKVVDAIVLATKSFEAYPTAVAAREKGKWLAKAGNNMAAVEAIAMAFTIEDPVNTEIDRGKDRMHMGEYYTKANGNEKGLGDLILQAYDRTRFIMEERLSRLKAADPNLQAAKVTEFTLTGLGGDKLAMASLKGKTIVMDFWATWCGPCRVQHPLYEQVREHFKNNPDVVFLAIDTDEDQSLVAPTLKERQWSTTNVYFESGLARLLEISSIPTALVIDKGGNIATRINGFSPDSFAGLLIERIDNALKN